MFLKIFIICAIVTVVFMAVVIPFVIIGQIKDKKAKKGVKK